MTVLFIHQYFTTREGAGATRSYEFSRHLAGKGHRVIMLTGTSQLGHVPEIADGGLITRVNIDGMEVVAVKVAYSNSMGYLRRALAFMAFMAASSWAAVRAKGVDVVVASSTPLTVGVTGMVAAFRHKAPLVFEARDLWPEYIEDFGLVKSGAVLGAMRATARAIYGKAKRIIVISDSMKRRLESLYPATIGKVTTVPFGADVEEDYSGRGRLELPEGCKGRFVVAYAGAIGYVNDVARLARIAARLDGRGVVFAVAGDGKERPALEEYIREKGIGNVFLLGKMNKRNVRRLVQMSDACMITHIYKNREGRVYINCEDTLSNKFFDYISAGRPVIINHESESSGYVRRNGCGIVVPHGDIAGAARMIEELKDSPADVERMGGNARALAERFDRRKMAALFEGVLLDAAGI